MNNREILEKAISKAVENGFVGEFGHEWTSKVPMKLMEKYGDNYYELIFSHDFAKAFWGEEMLCEECFDAGCYEATREDAKIGILIWKHHLQQLVLEGKPLLYLAKFL